METTIEQIYEVIEKDFNGEKSTVFTGSLEECKEVVKTNESDERLAPSYHIIDENDTEIDA